MHTKGFLLHLYIWLSISGFVLEIHMYGNDQLNACGARGALNRYEAIIVNSRKYPYLPHGRDFFEDPQPLWKSQLSFIHFFKFFGLTESPGNSNPFCGGSMDIFWNCTLKRGVY